MDREKTNIKGVLVLGEGLNPDSWMERIREEYCRPDNYGKSKAVEFEDGYSDEKDPSRRTHINFWVS